MQRSFVPAQSPLSHLTRLQQPLPHYLFAAVRGQLAVEEARIGVRQLCVHVAVSASCWFDEHAQLGESVEAAVVAGQSLLCVSELNELTPLLVAHLTQDNSRTTRCDAYCALSPPLYSVCRLSRSTSMDGLPQKRVDSSDGRQQREQSEIGQQFGHTATYRLHLLPALTQSGLPQLLSVAMEECRA